MSATIELYFDGGARPTNPGWAGWAAVLFLPNGDIVRGSESIGWATNNKAEYIGLLRGIKMAIDYTHMARFLDIYTDSKLVLGHMTQGHRRNDDRLRMLIRDSERLLHRHWEDQDTGERRWKMEWVPREENQIADELCTSAILKAKSERWSPFAFKAGLR